MSEVDQFFDDEIKAIAVDTKAIAKRAAEGLAEAVQRQIRRNFNNPSGAFSRGITIHEFENAVYVRLSPILSSHSRGETIQGNRRIWILLPDGERLGFKRMGTGGTSWDSLKRRYGYRLAFVPVDDGHVVLYRNAGKTTPIYKIQDQVQTKQRIRFYETADEIAEQYGLETENNPVRDNNRGVGFK